MSTQKIKGVTFIELLQLMFIAFKLLHVINWEWWQVLLPIIIKFTFSVGRSAYTEYNKKGK